MVLEVHATPTRVGVYECGQCGCGQMVHSKKEPLRHKKSR
jgi:hypothetical protein